MEKLFKGELMPLSPEYNDIFIPFKTKIPICRNDGALSYIYTRYIKGIKDNGELWIINLDNEKTIEYLSSISTMNNHIRNGNIVKRYYWQESK